MTAQQKQNVDWALGEIRRGLPPSALASYWARLRDAGLDLKASLNGRPPSVDEMRLINLAEQVERWHPRPVRLLDMARDASTRDEIKGWIAKIVAARRELEQAEAEYRDKFTVAVEAERRRTGSRAVVLTSLMQDAYDLREVELRVAKTRAALSALEKGFSDWRLRKWVEGRLANTDGTWDESDAQAVV